jgi:vancomycin resistance protein YoaR
MQRSISFKKRFSHPITISLSLVSIIILGPLLWYNIGFMGRVYPNISVAGINVGGKTPEEAAILLSEKIVSPSDINLVSQTQTFNLNTKTIGLTYDFNASAERAYNLTRTGNVFFDLFKRIQVLVKNDNLGLATNVNEENLTSFISIIAGQISIPPTYPSIEDLGGIVKVNKGSPGSQIDNQGLRLKVGYNLALADGSTINIPITISDPTLTDQEVVAAKNRGEKYLGKSLSANFETQNFNYTENSIIQFLEPRGGYKDETLNDAVFKIAQTINRDPQNPKFNFDGTKVVEFQPALDGITLDSEKFKTLLVDKLGELEESTDKNSTFDIPVTKTAPEISTDQVNDLGIKELIGRGTSTYFHSIPGRVFNVGLAASRINGTLVKPGDTFSFNQTLGDVSKFTGYKQAYIISGGRTVLGDGGGVCQVSTTLFRATLNAGLPIVERAAHAYRVGYYEQNSPPGIDATVYAPSPDFKFKNDTPGYILVEAKNDSKNYSLVFELYGTSDGRTASISKPTISNVSPPPSDLYQDDPTLPAGTIKQTDFAAWGARVVFNYVVTRGGEQIYRKTFVSNYQPWQAIYLRGTGPAI